MYTRTLCFFKKLQMYLVPIHNVGTPYYLCQMTLPFNVHYLSFLQPSIFKYKRQSFYKCFNATRTVFPGRWERFKEHRDVLSAPAASRKTYHEGIHLLHTIAFFFFPPNGMKSIVTRCSHLNFLANWIYCLKFFYTRLLIQRQTDYLLAS